MFTISWLLANSCGKTNKRGSTNLILKVSTNSNEQREAKMASWNTSNQIEKINVVRIAQKFLPKCKEFVEKLMNS